MVKMYFNRNEHLSKCSCNDFTLCNTIWTIIMCVKDLLDMMMKNNGGMAIRYQQSY
jgi:hypothetical protein